jgi:hypothetical protein
MATPMMRASTRCAERGMALERLRLALQDARRIWDETQDVNLWHHACERGDAALNAYCAEWHNPPCLLLDDDERAYVNACKLPNFNPGADRLPLRGAAREGGPHG